METAIAWWLLLLAGAARASEPARLETRGGTLHGTIELPASKPPFPVVLLIAGSGPTDRDGNSTLIRGRNNSLRMLAEALAAADIASLRYDKRAIGESARAGLKEVDLRFETYVDDAVEWGEQLRRDSRFRGLVVVGHSEGSLIGMLAARRLSAEGYVSIAGAGRPAGETILGQVRAKGVPPTVMKQVEDIVKSLVEGRTAEPVPAGLAALFRPSVQPYLISWFKYDPAREIGRLTMPVLILQGTTDIQIEVSDAKLLAAANPSARLVILDGMNHVLKDVPANPEKQIASYGDPALPLDGKLVSAITALVKSIRPRN